MVEGEEIVKIFCYFPDILFPFDLFLVLVGSISIIFVANFEYFGGFQFHNSRALKVQNYIKEFYHLVVNPQWGVPWCRRLVVFDGSHPDVSLGTDKDKKVSVKHI